MNTGKRKILQRTRRRSSTGQKEIRKPRLDKRFAAKRKGAFHYPRRVGPGVSLERASETMPKNNHGEYEDELNRLDEASTRGKRARVWSRWFNTMCLSPAKTAKNSLEAR